MTVHFIYNIITINVNELTSPFKRKIFYSLLTGSHETGIITLALQMKELRLNVEENLPKSLN